MTNQSLRLKRSLQRWWVRAEKARWIYGSQGRLNADGTVTVKADRDGFRYVTLDTGTLTIARNVAGVPERAGLPVRLRQEQGILIIDGQDDRLLEGDANAPITILTVNDVLPDSHGNIPLELDDILDVNAPTPASGSVLQFSDFDGLWSGVPIADLGLTLDDLNGVTAPLPTDGDVLARVGGDWINTPNIPVAVASTIHAATLDTGPLDADEVPGLNSADSFSLIRWTWTTIKAFLKTYFDTLYGRLAAANTWTQMNQFNPANTTGVGLGITRDLAAASTDSPVVSIIQDNSGDDQTAVRIQQDGTGVILVLFDGATPVFRVIDGGAVGVGISPTAAAHIKELQTTGEALRVERDLASASTDSPLVNLIQDNSGDDQVALRVQQDGTGDLVNYFDGATKVMAILDGGRLDIAQIIRALTSSGLRLEDDGGNLGISILDGGFVGAGIVPTTQLGVKAGASTNDAAVGGGLFVDSGTHANTTTGETDLATYTVPADTLSANNMEIYFEAWLVTATANSKTIKVKFGSDSFTVINAEVATGNVRVRGRIVRTGAATQDVLIECIANFLTAPVVTISTATRTLSGTNVLKLTGQGGATNDVKQEYFKVYWEDQNV